MKIEYKYKNFSWATEIVIDQANEIIYDYERLGLTLTLRQLYYQFVARDLIPNKQKEYARLGRILSDGRMAGLIDWNAIEDRTRNLRRIQTFLDPGEILETCANSFKLDHWEGQRVYLEVWIEKEALLGVIEPICRKLHVGYFACKGYVSKSEMHTSAKRMSYYQKFKSRRPIIIHLGDHDPSGIDMTRDIDNQQNIFDGALTIKRIALNMDQIEKYNPPPNPTKMTDSRSSGYVEKYGDSSWELDALDPTMMQGLVKEVILSYRDPFIHDKVIEQEKEYKDILNRVHKNWRNL